MSLTGLPGVKNALPDGVTEFMLTPIPHEFAIGGVYMPPLLVAGMFGIIAAMLTTRQLNRYRLSRYFFYPPIVSLALMIIYTVLIGTFIIGA
jgi:hypothetical protein